MKNLQQFLKWPIFFWNSCQMKLNVKLKLRNIFKNKIKKINVQYVGLG